MVFFLIILLLISFNGASFSKIKGFNTNYLDKTCTTAVNGIFVILIVFSHFRQYADMSGAYDTPYLLFRDHLGQMVVATFWFYSGYGMMEAIHRKGDVYIQGILSKFWKLLLRFDCAVMLFIVVDAVLGIDFPYSQKLIAFTSWTNVGNSNWYIFDILVEYLLMYAAFRISSKTGRHRNKVGILLYFMLTGIFIFVLMRADSPDYYYNSVIIMPFGTLYSETRQWAEKAVMHSDVAFSISVLMIGGIYIISFFHREQYGIAGYTVWALAFTALAVLFTMKVHIYNPLLEWFGAHVFSIYILQRLPMMVLNSFGYIDSHKYISLVIVFVTTIPLALIFEKGTGKLIALIEDAASTWRMA